jgi:competence protein ComEC
MLIRLACIILLGASTILSAQPNGKFQMHFISVGQGDCALLIAPNGSTVLFDDGVRNNCELVTGYLDSLHIDSIDYHVASHYHADHIGCAEVVLTKLRKHAYDRGGSYRSATYRKYEKVIGEKRRTAVPGNKIELGDVTVEFVAANATIKEGPIITTENENDLSVVCVVRYGSLDIVMGGDLSGFHASDYEDIETAVAPKVGEVEVYKVNHHCSSYSSNSFWLETIHPRIGIISTGEGNDYQHPAVDCLQRLHQNGVVTFWTSEGNGAEPADGQDHVVGSVVLTFVKGANTFDVVTSAGTSTFSTWEASTVHPVELKYVWSKNSSVYHDATCRYVKTITTANYQAGTVPPDGKTLHKGCPVK